MKVRDWYNTSNLSFRSGEVDQNEQTREVSHVENVSVNQPRTTFSFSEYAKFFHKNWKKQTEE